MKTFAKTMADSPGGIMVNLSINSIVNAKDPYNFGAWSFPLDELDRVLKLDLMYSPAHYSGGHRLNSKVAPGSINCIMLDFDDGMTLAEAKNIFAKYEGVIATTKSHQKQKHGVVCDRFRVILPTDTPITLSPEEYSRLMAAVMEIYPQADKACKNASRFYFATSESELYRLQGNDLFNWRELYDKVRRIEAVKDYERRHATYTQRETTSSDIEVALNRLNPDCEYHTWTEIGMALKDELGDTGFVLWDNWSRRGSKYAGEREMQKKWSSFNGAGVGIGTLFHYAKGLS